ncbi:cytochrome P450 [Streptomyces sp. NPDC020807]|uniref:cytochrome P450 n=1 Tax=Streptomyces sp. NPDC020807 TaxID=3155119 RepID=UPI0033BFDD36
MSAVDVLGGGGGSGSGDGGGGGTAVLTAPCPHAGGRLSPSGPEAAEVFFAAPDSTLSHAEGWDVVFGGRFGRGVLNLDGEPHRTYRQALMPLLRSAAVAAHRGTIEEVVGRAVSSLPVGSPFDLHAVTQTTAFAVAARLFAGLDEREAEELYGLYGELRTPPDGELGTPGGNRAARRVGRARRRVRELLRGAVVRLRDGDPADGPVRRLRALPGPPSDDVVAENIAILILAGYETTGYLSARLLWLLARHPEAQEAVRREVGGPPAEPFADGPFPAGSFLDGPFLDAVFQETARLHPPLAWLPRRALTDLVCGETRVPAGSEVFYAVGEAQRDPGTFAAPDAFRPERFTEGERHGRYALTPFGSGRRICAGLHLGTLETKLLAAAVVREFRLTVPPGPYVGDVSLNGSTVTPARPLLVRLDRIPR